MMPKKTQPPKFRSMPPDDYAECVRVLDAALLLVVKRPATTLGTIRPDIEKLVRIVDRME